MDKEKLKEQARVVMAKARAAMSEIKDNFKADEGATGARKIQSRFVNLWKSGTPGRVALIATPVVVLLLLVLVFGGGGSGSVAQSPVPAEKSVAQSPVPAEKPSAAAGDTGMSREEREGVSEENQIKEILALAKKSAEEDDNINFCGFFTGMSRYDAQDLVAYYKLRDGEYSIEAVPGKAVSKLWFSLKAVRRITRAGSTIEELAQAVANRVGNMKGSYGGWEHKTIDGIGVTFSNGGLTILNGNVALQKPIVTKANAQKDEKDANSPLGTTPFPVVSIVRNMVTIPGKNYKMGRTEVTQAQWEAVMGKNPSDYKGAENPVENVSMFDCVKFLQKLNALPFVKESGLVFRLPTEKEWEYACRAGSTGNYCRLADGSEVTAGTLGRVAWYDDNSGHETHPVGQKEPNAFGLYDMHGNVREWCEDLWEAGDSLRVSRGGDWDSSSRSCAAGDRDCRLPGNRTYDLGFRLAASQD